MGNVIKMDFYRLVKSLSFKICLGIVFLLSVADGPLSKIIYNVGRTIAEHADDDGKTLKEIGEWVNDVHVGNIIANQMGIIATAVFLLCVVWFSYADIQHGYIKNIAGQLPSRGHTIVSKFVVIQASAVLFYLVDIIGQIIGYVVSGFDLKFDVLYKGEDGAADKVFSFASSFAELGIKLLLLSGVCALVLLLTTGVGSNVAGTIVAVLCGAGFAGLAYSGITAGINKLFKLEDFDLGNYMPDSLYRTNLLEEGRMLTGLIVGVIAVVVLMYFTTTLYNKKDIK